MKRLIVPTTLFLLLTLAVLAPQARAQDEIENPDVTIEVDGMACPFCAYGVEKKLKQLDGVEALHVQIDGGRVAIKLEEGATVTEEAIREAVADAGFSVRAITWADGRSSASSSQTR